MIKLFKYSLILFTMSAIADDKISCSYQNKDSRELEPTENCRTISEDGLLSLNSDIIENIYWNKYGLDCAFIYGTKNQTGWYFINQSGAGRISPFIQDNDCASFTEGVAVGLSKGKVVFYNHSFEIVKHTEYVWASGFDLGFAKVCKGDLIKEYDSGGEHYQYKSGTCGFIDVSFNIVVPIEYPYESTPKPKS